MLPWDMVTDALQTYVVTVYGTRMFNRIVVHVIAFITVSKLPKIPVDNEDTTSTLELHIPCYSITRLYDSMSQVLYILFARGIMEELEVFSSTKGRFPRRLVRQDHRSTLLPPHISGPPYSTEF